MTVVDSATRLLSSTEESLRQLVADAAKSGDYAGVVQVAAWARTLSDILVREPRSANSKPVGAANHTSALASKGEKGSRHVDRRRHGREYPKFFRDGDRLIRVAWSKREKKEYEHKAPFSVLQSLSGAITDKASDGRIFSMEQLLPIRESDGNEIPSYQAYVALSLLRHTGLVDQHGRQGYSLPRPTEFMNALDAVWRSLPTE